jgi:hypothetical protein
MHVVSAIRKNVTRQLGSLKLKHTALFACNTRVIATWPEVMAIVTRHRIYTFQYAKTYVDDFVWFVYSESGDDSLLSLGSASQGGWEMVERKRRYWSMARSDERHAF